MGRIEGVPSVAGRRSRSRVLGIGWSASLRVAVLYPVFQAMVLRWWISGIRFGELTVASHLRTRAVYGAYLRFLGCALLFAHRRRDRAGHHRLALVGGLAAWLGKGTLHRDRWHDRALVGVYVVVDARLFDDLSGDREAARSGGTASSRSNSTASTVLDRVKAAGAAELGGRRRPGRRAQCRRDLTMADSRAPAIFFDGVTSARRAVLGRAAPDGAASSATPRSATCSRAGPIDELDHLVGARRRAAARPRRQRGARAARSARPGARRRDRRSARVPVDRTGATERRGRDQGRSPGASPRPCRWSWSPSFGVPALADQLAPLMPLSRRALARRGGRRAGARDARHRQVRTGRSNAAAATREAGRPRGARQADRQAGGGRRRCRSRSRPRWSGAARPTPSRCPAATSMCSRGWSTKSRERRRARRRDRARDRPCRASRRHALDPAGRRPVVPVRHAARRFRRRRRGGDRGARPCCSRPIRARSRPRPTATACELMAELGGDPRALGAILKRIAGAIHPGMEILRDHPDTKARVALINALAPRAAAAATAAGRRRMGRAEAHLHGPVRRAYGAPPHRRPSRPRGSPSGRAASRAVLAGGDCCSRIVIVRAGLLEIDPVARDLRRRAACSRCIAMCSRSAPSS